MNTRSLLLLLLIWTAASVGAFASPPRRAQTIKLTPVSFTIQGPAGGPNPAPSTLTVENSGTGRLKWSAVSSETWLTVLPNKGDLRAGETIDLSVSADLTTLGAGTRTVTITVSDPAATNTPQFCTVTVQTSAGPQLSVTPPSITMTAPEFGPNPPGQNVTIQNTGGASLTWTAVAAPSWLSVNDGGGTLDPGALHTVTLSANVIGLAAGPYAGTLTVTAPGAANSPKILNVSLTVSQAPVFAFTPGSLSFDAPVGGANPPAQTLTIRNAGGGTLNWSLGALPAWLAVNPPSNPLTGGASAPLNVTVNTGGLLEGTYVTELTFTAAGATNSPKKIPVVLNVNSIPKIGINPKTLSFVVATDAAQSSASAVSVTNTGSGTLTWTSSTSASWLHSSPAGGTLGALVSEPLFLSVQAAGYSPGHYTATVEVADPGAGNSPQTIAVDLTVTSSSLPTHAPAGQCGLLGLELLLVLLWRFRNRGVAS